MCGRIALYDEPRPERLHLGMYLAGIDHTCWFDIETGIVLRHAG